MNFQELLDERTLMKKEKSGKSGTMPIPGSEGAARKDVARAGFRKRGPVQDPKVEKSGEDVPVWVRTHKSKGDYAAHTAKKAHKEGETGVKGKMGELRKQFHQTGAEKDSEVHDITVGSPKKNIKEPGQKARAFVKTLKDVKDKMKERKGVATNTPTAISSSGKKRKRSDEEGAEQRGRIYQKLGMGERNPKTGVQMAKLKEGRTFQEFMMIVEGMSMKDFKANRRNIKRREDSADAKSRGHVSKNIVTHGKTYSSDEAKAGRANMSDNERATRKSVAMNPDQVGDTRETSDKTKNPNKLRKQKAMGELGESAVPGKPAERLGAVTAIPQDEREAARQRILAKVAANKKKREEKGRG
jgi:hypothetical protein